MVSSIQKNWTGELFKKKFYITFKTILPKQFFLLEKYFSESIHGLRTASKNCLIPHNVFICFLACTSDEYTCRDGTCVDMDKVCDGKMDCKDKSDELECRSIRFDPTYLKILPPPPLETEKNQNDKTELRISLTVESILDLDEVHTSIVCFNASASD